MLATRDSDGGNAGGCWDDYWWFDASGPHQLDFSAVDSAVTQHIPAGAHFSARCDQLRLEQSEIESPVQAGDARCHACDWIGKISVKFRLEGWHAEPVAVEYSTSP